MAERIAFDETDAKPVAGRIDFDETDIKPVENVGEIETALRTAGQAAAPIVRTLGLAESTLQRVFRGPEAQQRVIGKTEETVKGMEDVYSFKPTEAPSLGGEVLGTAASLPQALLGQGVAPGINKAAQVIERGGTMGEAAQAGSVTGAVQQALQLLPMHGGAKVAEKVGGGAVRQAVAGAATGAAINVPAGIVGREVENLALPEGKQFEELKQPNDLKTITTEAGVSAAFGALGALGAGHARSKAKKAADTKPPPFPADKFEDLGDGSYRAPNGSTITKEAWEASSQRLRDGWMEEAPKEQKPGEPKLQEEIDRLREEHPSGPVAKVVEDIARQREKTAKTKADATELRRAADLTTDVELKKALNKRADKLDPPEKIPVGEAKEVVQPKVEAEAPPKKIPVGEVIEEKIPVGETNEVPGVGGKIPAGEAKEITRSGVEPTQEPKPGSIPKGEVKELYIPPEKRNASDQVPKQESVQQKRVQGNEGRAPAEAGGGDRVLDTAKGAGPEAVAPRDWGNTAGEAAQKIRDLKAKGEISALDEAKMLSIANAAKSDPNIRTTKLNNFMADRGTPPPKRVTKVEAGKDDDLPFDIASPKDLSFPKIEASMIDAAQREQTRGQYRSQPRADDGLRVVGKDDRGITQVRTALREGMRDGTVHKDGGELALWALEKNPSLARGLKLKAHGEAGPGLGLYDHTVRTIELFKNHNSKTAAHEILHHSERMMPEIVQAGIRREWKRALSKAVASAKTPAEKQGLKDMMSSAFRGDAKARVRAMDAMREGVIDKNRFYHLLNPSEFWAVNAANILHERHAARGSWRNQAKRWLKELVEKAKGLVGVRSDAPLLKALDEVMNPKAVRGERSGAKMLAEGGGREPRKVPRDFQDIAVKPPKPTLAEETKKEAASRNFFDSLRRIQSLQEQSGVAGESKDIRQAARLQLGKAQERVEKLTKEFVDPLQAAMKRARKAGLTVKDADDYVSALHAPERNREIAKINPKMPDGGSGLMNKQAKEIIGSFTPEQKKHLDAIAKIVHDMNAKKLKGMLDDGLITKDAYDAMTRTYKNYVPLKTLEQEHEFTGLGRGYQTWANDIKEALGRTSRAGSPIASSLMDATHAIARGERARVNKAIWEFANDPKGRDYITPYESLKRKGDVWVDEKGNVVQPPKQLLKNEKGPDGQVRQVIDQRKVEENTVPLVINGEPKRVLVADPALKEALATAGTPEKMGDLLRATTKYTRAFARTLTEWNPAFAPVNQVRDVITSTIRAKRLGLSALDFTPEKILKAQADVVAHMRGKNTEGAKLYEEMVKAGGKTGAYGLTDLDATFTRFEKAGAKLGYEGREGNETARALTAAAETVGKGLSKWNEVFEYSTRLAAYRAARAKGMSPGRAASVARQITVDFNVSGRVGRAFGPLYVFANAALQGLAGDMRDLRSPATRYRMLSMVALGMGVQAYNELWGGENKETGEKNITSQNDSKLDSHITLLKPGERSGGSMPLPPGVAAGLYTMGRRLWRLGSEGDVERESLGILSAAAQAMMPLRFAEGANQVTNILQGATPALARPFADIAVNSNQFGMPIVPKTHGDDTSPPPYHTISRSSTSDLAKGVSKFINVATGGDDVTPGLAQRKLGGFVSPEALEYLLGYYGGGVAQTVLQSKNIVKNTAEGKEQDINKIPVVKRFAFKEPETYISRRYQEIKPEIEYARDYRKLGKEKEANPKALRALDTFEGANKELTVLFRSLRTAKAEGKDPEQLQSAIKRVQSNVIRAYNGQPAQ